MDSRVDKPLTCGLMNLDYRKRTNAHSDKWCHVKFFCLSFLLIPSLQCFYFICIYAYCIYSSKFLDHILRCIIDFNFDLFYNIVAIGWTGLVSYFIRLPPVGSGTKLVVRPHLYAAPSFSICLIILQPPPTPPPNTLSLSLRLFSFFSSVWMCTILSELICVWRLG